MFRVLIDYCDTLAHAANKSEWIPCAGNDEIKGMIYSSQDITVSIDQGCKDKGGAYTYRHNQIFTVLAGATEGRRFPIFGKFIKLTINNNSGNPSAIECFFGCR